GWRRLYHPILDDHAYTISQLAANQLIGQGYLDEGIQGYLVSTGGPPVNQPPNMIWVEQPQGQYLADVITFYWRSSDDNTAVEDLFYHVIISGTNSQDIWCQDTVFTWYAGLGSHTLTVTARDAEGLLDPTPLTHSFSVVTQPLPQAPTNLQAQSNDNQHITLSWVSNDQYTDEFKIFRDNYWLADIRDRNIRQYFDSNVVVGKTYQYQVRAYNYSGYTDSQPIVFELTGGICNENGFNYPVGYPNFTQNWYDAQPFGSVLYLANKFHAGADLNKKGGDLGETIYAPSNGVVVYKNDNASGWGKCLVISFKAPGGYYYQFPDGTKKSIVYFLFAHLQEIFIQGGGDFLSYEQIICHQTTVQKGWQIGTVGEIPSGSGPHLHLECWSSYDASNPLGYGYYDELPIHKYDPMEFIANNRSLSGSFAIYCHNYNRHTSGAVYFEPDQNWTRVTGYQQPSNPVLGYNNYLFYSATNRMAQAEWRFNIPTDGEYDLYVHVPNYAYTTTRAWYNLVRGQTGPQYLYVDGSQKNNEWVKVGRFYFRSDMNNYLLLT
ncbi:MAG: hypothetical protein COX77_01440, partial [Candidatus Komeilibacteria bacterium CG_4_10_14_0_2_um_filter_37_10]